MNLDLIKKKMNSLKKGGQKNDDYKKTQFVPEAGDQVIRIVPSKYNKDNPFTELYFHYDLNGKKVTPSLLTWGEKDPIDEFAKKLKKENSGEAYNPENYRFGKNLEPKMRVVLPVVVRGKENEGVKLWSFGVNIYQELLSLAEDEEIGDFTDVFSGRDIKLKTTTPQENGTKFNKTTIRIAASSKPLSQDKDLVNKLLNEQPNPLEQLDKPTYESLKSDLQSHLGISSSEEAKVVDTSTTKEEISNSKFSKVEAKKSESEKFDDLFGDEEFKEPLTSENNTDEDDDFPF